MLKLSTHSLVATGLVIALVSAPPALAQSATSKSFNDLDVDGDGRISLTEAERDADVSRAFIGADANKDGYLSPAEFRRLGQSLTPETSS
jgi:hypothetical protein